MTPDPAVPATLSEALSTALHSTPFQAVTAGIALVSLVLAVISFVRTQFRGPKVRFVPADALGLVRAPLGGLQAINVMGTLINSGGSAGALLRLEARVYDASTREHRFIWNELYRYREGGHELMKVSDPQPIPVKAGDAVPVFVQLSPADGKIRFDWPSGECRVELLGWVNAENRLDKPQVSKTFHVSVDGHITASLRESEGGYRELRVPVVEWRHPEQVSQDAHMMNRAG
jgi:hypothetical protein